ncbi:GMC family oxidoreductase [Starkeya koreensis]|uniref:GMC family oxidoreductase n=1 Tax=Ancylobacter koreensis TaxID=266121 RepID=A0ABT0DR89_9HYPH|nr:GMC family oxidoreductase [Ancylobacter koreensis]MCK0209627.1 GMC family oxidoreductase [Ancylobacter koreensis]
MAAGYIDARGSEVGEEIEASVAIFGAGAAGLTLARELSRKIGGVALIEAGGFDLEGETQSLYFGNQLGLPYYNLAACRLRYFGGTTNHWSGFCRANDAIDYEGRPVLGLPKWPVTPQEVEPYIRSAAESLGISGDFFDVGLFVESLGLSSDELADGRSEVLETKVFQVARDIRLGKIYREPLGSTGNLTVYHHLNAVHVRLAADGSRVEAVDCATLTGRKIRVKAKITVLCCHAIENARLLLVSNDVMNVGIGNESGCVGRYFMDHTHIFASRFIPSPTFPLIYDKRFTERNNLNLNVGFKDDFLRKENLLQYYCRFNPVYFDEDIGESVRNIRYGLFEPGDVRFLKDVANVLSDIHGVAAQAATYQDMLPYPLPRYYKLEHRLEQAPNPHSRIVISDRKDALGSAIADLDWQINEHDIDSFRRGQEYLVNEFSALGYGRAEIEEITPELVKSRVSGHYHHIGTTRMSDTPADGVVNGDCRVHNVANLYIGGSSTFPTAGYSGPTMMIIGFSLRLADRIVADLQA